MFFEYPKLLWLLVVPGLLILHYVYLELAQRHPHLRVSTSVPWLVKNTSVTSAARHIPFVFRIIALSLIVIAIARPRSSEVIEKIASRMFRVHFGYLNMNGVMKVMKDMGLEQKNQRFDMECSLDTSVRLSLVDSFLERMGDVEGCNIEEL